MKTLLPFTDFLWILQKEEYETSRYLWWLRRFFFRRNFVVSEKLVYTARAKLTLALAVALWLLSLVILVLVTGSVLVGGIALILSLALVPLFVLAANVLLHPVFALAHARIRRQAAAKVAAHAPMEVIAIVGSYGKTTTKHFLYELLRHRYRTQMTPGTVNTTTGIADWLLRELAGVTEVLILEMDAYHKGEIAASCALAPPSVVIVTNIGEQHLARFKTHEALRQALGEAVACAKPDALVVADKTTMAQLNEFAGNRVLTTVDTSMPSFGHQPLTVARLSGSNRENLARALAAAEHLNIPASFIEDAVGKLALPERRQHATELYGYEAIDDSYNISLATARAGLAAGRALAREKGKKLLVIAAGIPELGPEQKSGNVELGEALGAGADHTIVLGTMFAEELEQGLGNAPHTRYAHLDDFLARKDTFPPSEWVLLMEPALPDLYY